MSRAPTKNGPMYSTYMYMRNREHSLASLFWKSGGLAVLHSLKNRCTHLGPDKTCHPQKSLLCALAFKIMSNDLLSRSQGCRPTPNPIQSNLIMSNSQLGPQASAAGGSGTADGSSWDEAEWMQTAGSAPKTCIFNKARNLIVHVSFTASCPRFPTCNQERSAHGCT